MSKISVLVLVAATFSVSQALAISLTTYEIKGQAAITLVNSLRTAGLKSEGDDDMMVINSRAIVCDWKNNETLSPAICSIFSEFLSRPKTIEGSAAVTLVAGLHAAQKAVGASIAECGDAGCSLQVHAIYCEGSTHEPLGCVLTF